MAYSGLKLKYFGIYHGDISIVAMAIADISIVAMTRKPLASLSCDISIVETLLVIVSVIHTQLFKLFMCMSGMQMLF